MNVDKTEVPLVSEQISQRITSLRFPLMILIVFIHNNLVPGGLFAPEIFNQGVVGIWLQRLISDGIADGTVPIFFLFSGYLAFKKNDSYATVLKKKTKSLLIPYMLWITFYILFGAFCRKYVLLSKIFYYVPSVKWNWKWLLKAYTGYKYNNLCFPYAGQFWYVRDLLLLFLFLPALHFLYAKFPKTTFLFSFFLFLLPSPVWLHSGVNAFFFFTCGALCALHEIDFFALADSFSYKELLLVFLCLFFLRFTVFSQSSGRTFVSHQFQIICACLLLLKCSGGLVRTEKLFDVCKTLAPYSFFLYAVHMPFLTNCIKNVWIHFLPLKNQFYCLLEYFCVTSLIVTVGTFLGIVLNKCIPFVFGLLTGGRNRGVENAK